jgi:hypothetical protein
MSPETYTVKLFTAVIITAARIYVNGNGTAVEQLSNNPKIKGSNPGKRWKRKSKQNRIGF